MKSEFAFINSETWRSWERIIGTNAALGSAFATIGGPSAVVPFALNFIKEGASRLLSEYDIIDSKYEHIAAELITTALVITVAAFAVTFFSTMTASTVFYSAIPMVLETFAVQLSVADVIDDEEQRERYLKKCCS